MAPPTGVTAGSPGSFTPAGSDIPYKFANLVALGPLGQTTTWSPGQSVVLGDTSRAYWGGTAWVAGPRPNEGVAGTPGVYRPASLTRSTVASLVAVLPDPPTPWPNGTWVPLTGAEQFANWNGAAWIQGKSKYVAPSGIAWPAPPPVIDRSPSDLQVLVALPSLASAWGRGLWGQARWGGFDFTDPYSLECQMEGITVERGRNDPLDHIDPGGARISAQDPNMILTPWIIPADGFRQWRTGVPIKVRTGDGDLFTGSISRIASTEDPRDDVLQKVDIDCRDPLSHLAASNQNEQAEQGANEFAAERLARIANFAHVPGWVEADFDPGMVPMQPTTLAQTALSEMWLTADSDGGMISCTPDGVVHYWDIERGLTEDRRVVPQVLFTDDPDLPSDIPTVVCASSFEVTDDAQAVVNWISIAAKGGTAQVVTDPDSISWNGIKSTQRHDLVHAGGDAWSREIGEILLSRVTRQSVVVTPLKYDALHSNEAWDAAHALDVGDRVAIHRSRGGHRLDISSTIDEIRHDITPYSWFVTITLAPGTQRDAYTRWGVARWGVDEWS